MLSALLIGEQFHALTRLARFLEERGCRCRFALSHGEAQSLLKAERFDLVFSPIRLPDGSSLPLIESLHRSKVTWFYFHPVEKGCWWLPALWLGEECFGRSAFRPGEFVFALNEAIEEIQSRHLIEAHVEISDDLLPNPR